MDLKNIFRHTDRDLTKMDSQPDTITEMPDSGGGGSRIYYYVGAVYNGTPVVLGRFYSWEQANMEGRRKLPCPFEIYPLTTGDMRVATKKIKYELLNKDNMDVIMRRSQHVIEPDDDIDNNDNGYQA